jgi:hypothetical protein
MNTAEDTRRNLNRPRRRDNNAIPLTKEKTMKLRSVICLTALLALVGCQSMPPQANSVELIAADAIEISTGGKAMSEQEFFSLARKTFFGSDWVVINAANGAVTAKRNATRFFSGGYVPVNDKLQWDDTRKSYVFRAEMRLSGDKVIFSYLPHWGSTSDEPLHNLRKSLALMMY